MSVMYLYTMPNCEVCDKLKLQLEEKGEEFTVVPVTNPLLEAAIAGWFNDKKVHAPILVKDDGLFMYSTDGVLAKIGELTRT